MSLRSFIFLGLFMLLHNPTFSTGTIIILNGPSASGKSSIQNEIQQQFDELYLKVGIDTFFDALIPDPNLSDFEKTKRFAQYTKAGELIRSGEIKQDTNGHQIVPLTVGSAGDKIISGMHAAIAAYASKGNNLVVDYILYKPDWQPDLVNALLNQKVYFIGINAPLAILEEREKKRGTSPIGHARSHYDTVHQGMIYDLELDVSNLTPAQSAAKIKKFVLDTPSPTALEKLSK